MQLWNRKRPGGRGRPLSPNLQKGKVYRHGNFWMFRYKVPVFENGKKTWQDEYQKLAPIDQYDSVAALRKDGLVPRAPDTASLNPERTHCSASLWREFISRVRPRN